MITITIPDQRMIELIERLKETGRIRYRQEFLDVIGMDKGHFRRVRLGQQHFTVDQIKAACEEYAVNANWIMGFEEHMYRRTKKVTTPIAAPKKKTG